jgi:hypothetical protein
MIIALLLLCALFAKQPVVVPILQPPTVANHYPFVESIPLPPGYSRIPVQDRSYAAWLRHLPLRSDQTVYLWNGQRKANQSAQYAVVDLPIGNQDLQQCADVIMRLRAEWLFQNGRANEIDFIDNNRTHYALQKGEDLNTYLKKVFVHCGTASLEKQLANKSGLRQVEGGDVLIKGGSPGHAMLVMDVAQNAAGKRIFLLAQGYMPAQDIHVVRNPNESALSPWYDAWIQEQVNTPEWTFYRPCLKTWDN